MSGRAHRRRDARPTAVYGDHGDFTATAGDPRRRAPEGGRPDLAEASPRRTEREMRADFLPADLLSAGRCLE